MNVDKQKTRSISRWVTGFVAVLAVALLGSATFGSLAQASSDMPVAKAQVDPGLNGAISALNGKARENWPNEFGEVWIKWDGPDAGVYVGFTEGAEAKVAALVTELDFPRPDLLVPVTVKYSSKQLEERMMIMVGDRDAAQQGLPPMAHVTDGRFDMFADVENGVIVIGMPVFTSEFKTTFLEAYGDDLRFSEQEVSVPVPGVKTRLPKLNRKLRKVKQNLRQATKKLKRAKVKHRKFKRRCIVRRATVKRSYRKVRKLKRRTVKQRQRKQTLTRKIRNLS